MGETKLVDNIFVKSQQRTKSGLRSPCSTDWKTKLNTNTFSRKQPTPGALLSLKCDWDPLGGFLPSSSPERLDSIRRRGPQPEKEVFLVLRPGRLRGSSGPGKENALNSEVCCKSCKTFSKTDKMRLRLLLRSRDRQLSSRPWRSDRWRLIRLLMNKKSYFTTKKRN